MTSHRPTVAVIGAGPVGLAAAAHLLEHDLEPLVLEAGESIGAAVRAWGHIRLFSPWQYTLDDAGLRLLRGTGWHRPSPETLPTGHELVDRYLEPLAAVPALRERVRTGHRVTAVNPDAEGFALQVERADAGRTVVRAGAVLDTSGTWALPSGLGIFGEPVSGEQQAEDDGLLLGPLPDVRGADRERFAGRRTVVVGAGHSAVNTLLALADLQREEPATQVIWAVRRASPEKTYGGGDRDELPARGALGARLRELVDAGRIELITSAQTEQVLAEQSSGVGVVLSDGRVIRADVLIRETGFRPDLGLLDGLALDTDPALEAPSALAPLIDPTRHSCGSVPAHGASVLAQPEEGLFIAGMKSYGRAPTFLLATGYEQVRSIAAHLAGEDASPRQLNLPETGVCGGDPTPAPPEKSGLGSGASGSSASGASALPLTAETTSCCS